MRNSVEIQKEIEETEKDLNFFIKQRKPKQDCVYVETVVEHNKLVHHINNLHNELNQAKQKEFMDKVHQKRQGEER